ncbi:hypothetical protein Prum_083070 [Phytohabitans rumicis]|uniref:Uncharacterized protein n=1 Tax=Phytohabitans rumicis TaxID=1076125 RepID=A0A6V8LPP0_9ACTN|nr:hypothetical protein Prum_083070 [Phytohabitans rumicis]
MPPEHRHVQQHEAGGDDEQRDRDEVGDPGIHEPCPTGSSAYVAVLTPFCRISANPRPAPSVPSVASSGGTFRYATTRPLIVPMSSPASSAPASATSMYQPLVWSAATSAAVVPSPVLMSCSACTANTSPSTMPLGMDRSTPAVITTNVVPTLTTVRMATFCASCTKLLRWVNVSGAMMENAAMISNRTPKVTIVGLRTSAQTKETRGVTGSCVSGSVGLVCAVISPPRSRTRRKSPR